MRTMNIMVCIVLIICFAQCATQAKIEYNIPTWLTDIQKEELKIKLERGYQLYKPNCSKCHGIFKKGKDGIPNFTAKQLDVYKARHELRDSTNHAYSIGMSQEDLSAIIHFLMLRKGAQPVAQSTGDGK